MKSSQSAPKARAWIPVDEFRGEPNTSPMAWWWAVGRWGQESYLELDAVLLGELGEVVGKGGCGADFCSHVMLVQDGELPIGPKGEVS